MLFTRDVFVVLYCLCVFSCLCLSVFFFFFFFNDTATTEIYTLSLHDALPISCRASTSRSTTNRGHPLATGFGRERVSRSEEHTSELQSHSDLVCRLLLEKKKKKNKKKNKRYSEMREKHKSQRGKPERTNVQQT